MFINFEKKRLIKSFSSQRGASMLEVILAIALVLMLIPFMYYQIADMNNAVKDVAVANKIVKLHDGVIDYIRVHQSEFPANGELQEFTEEELAELAPADRRPYSGWVFKNANGFTEIYLAFQFDSRYKTANIAKYIGSDAAIVNDDNAAYAHDWAVDFGEDVLTPGDLIFKITHNFSDSDASSFLHRGTIGGNLNRMLNDLLMNNNNLFNVRDMLVADVPESERQTQSNIGDVVAQSLTAKDQSGQDAALKTSKTLFALGADASNVQANFTNLNVQRNLINFKTIVTQNLNAENKFSVFNANVFTNVKVEGGVKLFGSVSGNEDLNYSTDFLNFKNIDVGYLDAGFLVQGNKITGSDSVMLGNVCNGDEDFCETFVAGPVYYTFDTFTSTSVQKLPAQMNVGYNGSVFYIDGINVGSILGDFFIRSQLYAPDLY